MYGPSSVISTMLSRLTSGIYSEQDSGYTLVYCSAASSMKSIFLYINGMYLEVTPASFLLNVGTASDGSQVCVIGIGANSDNTWLLGDVFLKNYLTVWDDANSKISFAPHKYTTATIATGTKPTTYLSYATSSSNPYLSAIIQFIVVLIISYLGKEYGVTCITNAINSMKSK